MGARPTLRCGHAEAVRLLAYAADGGHLMAYMTRGVEAAGPCCPQCGTPLSKADGGPALRAGLCRGCHR